MSTVENEFLSFDWEIVLNQSIIRGMQLIKCQFTKTLTGDREMVFELVCSYRI